MHSGTPQKPKTSTMGTTSYAAAAALDRRLHATVIAVVVATAFAHSLAAADELKDCVPVGPDVKDCLITDPTGRKWPWSRHDLPASERTRFNCSIENHLAAEFYLDCDDSLTPSYVFSPAGVPRGGGAPPQRLRPGAAAGAPHVEAHGAPGDLRVAVRREPHERGGGVGRAVARGVVVPDAGRRRAVQARVREQQGGGARHARREEGARRRRHQGVQQQPRGLRRLAAVRPRLHQPQARPITATSTAKIC
ncbi:hypothetical protein ACP70R_022239 [Stipagrostis hirtigluma subsp. patula]